MIERSPSGPTLPNVCRFVDAVVSMGWQSVDEERRREGAALAASARSAGYDRLARALDDFLAAREGATGEHGQETAARIEAAAGRLLFVLEATLEAAQLRRLARASLARD